MTSQKPNAQTNPETLAHSNELLDNLDQQRTNCPLMLQTTQSWTALGHEAVVRVVTDHHTFSNKVSQHLQIPNGLDLPEHTAYRQLIDKFFTPERMRRFEPRCRVIAQQLMDEQAGKLQLEAIAELAERFALAVQCDFLGWPKHCHQPLREWLAAQHRAQLTNDKGHLAHLADGFAEFVKTQLADCRAQTSAEMSVTRELLDSRLHGQPLPTPVIVSILRNWTMGEIDTIAAAVGIIVAYLARNPSLQSALRASPELIPEAIDEILRIQGPLLSNRRRCRKTVSLLGQTVPAGASIDVNWVAANRDPAQFPSPDEFRWHRDHQQNLLYGAGMHVCPGAPLARLELQVFVETLLALCPPFTFATGQPIRPAEYPGCGYSQLWLDFANQSDHSLQ